MGLKIDRARRSAAVALAITLTVLASGCHRKRKTTSQPKSDAYADQIKQTVAQKQIKVMHWPDYADYQPLVQTFYDDRNYEVAWVGDDGQPTKQAQAFITAFQDAAAKGLNPDDFDASLWMGRIAKLAGKNQDDIATFDAAMTVAVMRYISDLRIGRVNPTHFNFDINAQSKKYDLPEFVSDNAVDADDVPKLIASVEPDSDQYRKTEDALRRYLDLVKRQGAANAQPLPTVAKPIAPGGQYPAADALEARLELEGDLPGGDAPAPAPEPAATSVPASSTAPSGGAGQPGSGAGYGPGTQTSDAGASGGKVAAAKGALTHAYSNARAKTLAEMGKVKTKHGSTAPASATAPAAAPVTPPKPPLTAYTAELADGVKHYQARHGITPDGKLSAATIASMNVPLSARTQQLADSLERWRWLPAQYVNAPLMVNLPEFVLRGFGPDHAEQFKMRVVDGQVVGEHQTPVFVRDMKYVIFRPYWNVPNSIVKKELTGHIGKSGVGYLEQKGFETTDHSGKVVSATAAAVEHGEVEVRQKPGPKNSLGLIKFMFPNEYDIYLHSTPQPELFERTRRDFSHGCIRVQHPDDLAVWVLKDTPGDWDLQKVQDAMNSGQDNHQVNLAKPIPIVIFYATAGVGEDGSVNFFDDIYKYDQSLDAVLAHGMPYPAQQQPVNPHASGGDTT